MIARPSNPVAFLGLLLLCGTLCLSAAAQESDTVSQRADTLEAPAVTIDSTGHPVPAAPDSILLPASPVDKSVPAVKKPRLADTTGKNDKGIKLVKRTYNGRWQVILATGMMIFVVAIMTAAQQWNPR